MAERKFLTKTAYMRGRQCKLNLWKDWNKAQDSGQTKQIPDSSSKQPYHFWFGNKIGALAQKYFSGKTIEVEGPFWDLEKRAENTEAAIDDGYKTIFEATAINPADDTSALIDVLRKVRGKEDEWDLIEVKSSQTLKPYQIEDIAFQRHVFAGAGYNIRRCYVMLVRGDELDKKKPDPKKLFRMKDVTDEVMKRQKDVKSLTAEFNKVARQADAPEIEMGDHCDKPFSCPFKEDCKTKKNGGPSMNGVPF